MKHVEMLDCDAVMRQLWDYLDGELTAEREEAVRAHLTMCNRCFPQKNFEESFLRVLAQSRREHSRAAALKDRILLALRADGFAA